MPNQVDSKIKEQRSKKIIELSENNEKQYNNKYIGRKVEVLWEEQKGTIYKGHTRNYILVEQEAELENNKNIENMIEKVYIKDAEKHCIIAEKEKA